MAKKNVKQKLKEVQPKAETLVPKQESISQQATNDKMLFHKENYILMGVGLLLIFIGFALMAGGKSADPTVFAADEIYSFRRITLAPILVLLGFAVEGYAILKKPSKA